jgi:hypothetical protein
VINPGRKQVEDDGGAGNAPVGVWLEWIDTAIDVGLAISVVAYHFWKILSRAHRPGPRGSRSAGSAESRAQQKSRRLRQQTKHKGDEDLRRRHRSGHRMGLRLAESREQQKSRKLGQQTKHIGDEDLIRRHRSGHRMKLRCWILETCCRSE